MFKQPGLAALLTVVLSAAVLLAQNISSETNPSADFSKYKTFHWVHVKAPNLVRGSLPPGALSDEEADAQIRNSVERQLLQKGFVRSKGKKADLLLNYFGVVSYRILDWEEFRKNRRSNVEGAGQLIPYEHWKPMAEAAEEGYAQREGSLTIDVVEAKSNRLLWRGSMSKAVINREQGEASELKQAIDAAVAGILETLPARKQRR